MNNLSENSPKVERDSKGRLLKGVILNPNGVKKGTKQRATQVKLAFYDAFDQLGGITRLVEWIKETKKNENEFYKLLLQILPKEIQGEGFGDTKIIVVRDKETKSGTNSIRREISKELPS